MKTAIIIPAFNEEKTIANTIKKFNAAMPSAHIFVINNNKIK
jgi:glycosyltransferase involved in cell wall biosynthesis